MGKCDSMHHRNEEMQGEDTKQQIEGSKGLSFGLCSFQAKEIQSTNGDGLCLGRPLGIKVTQH